VRLGRTTPVLRIFDEAKAKEFYVGFLGFTPGAALRIATEGLEDFQRELIAKGYKYARPGIEEMPWGRDMTVAIPSATA
jgi:hypothetical protein